VHSSTLAKNETDFIFNFYYVTISFEQPNGRASEYNSVHERLFKEGEQRKKETQLAVSASSFATL
jgi:hypothetical protein